jgi:hypothetical protein
MYLVVPKHLVEERVYDWHGRESIHPDLINDDGKLHLSHAHCIIVAAELNDILTNCTIFGVDDWISDIDLYSGEYGTKVLGGQVLPSALCGGDLRLIGDVLTDCVCALAHTLTDNANCGGNSTITSIKFSQNFVVSIDYESGD